MMTMLGLRHPLMTMFIRHPRIIMFLHYPLMIMFLHHPPMTIFFRQPLTSVLPSSINGKVLPSISQSVTNDPSSPPRASTSFSHSPEEVSPLPKLAEKRSKRKRKSAGNVVLTSSPYKNELLNEQNRKVRHVESMEARQKQRSIAKRGKLSTKQKGKSSSLRSAVIEQNDDGNDTECIFCFETFFSSNKGEGWIRCGKCVKWAHDECASVDETIDVTCVPEISLQNGFFSEVSIDNN